MLDSWSSKPGVTQVQIYGHIQKTRVKSDTPGTRTARPLLGSWNNKTWTVSAFNREIWSVFASRGLNEVRPQRNQNL